MPKEARWGRGPAVGDERGGSVGVAEIEPERWAYGGLGETAP